MSFEPTPSQALLLFGLLARHGECAQAELMPKVKKADREALVKARLVFAEKVGRGLHLRLEDAGWAWAGGHLAAELPPAQRALSDMLLRLSEHLARSGKTLAEVIGSKPRTNSLKEDVVKRAKAGRSRKKAKTTPSEIRAQIEDAYFAITGGKKNEPVRLNLIRERLPDIPRKKIDSVLLEILAGDRCARLLQIDDPTAISQEEALSAVVSATESYHILWIF